MTADEVLKLIRAEAKRVGTQAMLAEAMGVSQQYVSDLLTGRRDLPLKGPVLDYFNIEAEVRFRRNRYPDSMTQKGRSASSGKTLCE